MKFNILTTLSFIFIFSACTEVIKLDLNSSNPQIVVEGFVPVNGNAKIAITKSINFDQKDSFPSLSKANVTLTDNLGNSEVLTESSSGIYISKRLKGVVGRTYNLSVKTADKTITSACKIPNEVKFDSLNVSVAENFGGGRFGGNTSSDTGKLYMVKVLYKDPVLETNYYRFIEYVNNFSTGNIYVYDDRLTNGKTNEKTLLNFNLLLNKGDIITIEMQCIDRAVFEYFNSFGNIGMGSGSSTPANPYTNLTGTALGYFSAHTIERKQFVIK